jgi:putative proteasome-type protease
MTYCVGVLLNDGLVLAADSRTSAGVDYISTFRKLTVFEAPGDRFLVLMAAGNLATSQAVVTMVSERLEEGTEETSLFKAPTMFGAARVVGNALREVIATDGPSVRSENADPTASFLLGGQINSRSPRLFQIYNAGNFIEATPETPFLQIGETKYGKPILDRVIRFDMSLERAAKAALISFDSTMRSNISVGPPIDLVVYRRDIYRAEHRIEVAEGDRYFDGLRRRYGEGLARLFDRLPDPPLDTM